MTAIGEDAAKLANHPTHSLAKNIGTGVVASTLAGVGTYQINAHLARRKGGAPVPPPSPYSGGTEQPGAVLVNAQQQYTKKKRKGGK